MYPEYRIVITGHSLGGGISGTLALIMASDPDIMRLGGFESYPFASPPTVSVNFNQLLKQFVTCCVMGDDIVTRLCVGSIRDLIVMCRYWRKMSSRHGE
jgi:hypothetical protein